MAKKIKKRYAAWARKKGSKNPFVISVIYAYSIKDAKKYFEENKYEIDGRVFLSKVKY